ncbi:MAG: polysaccharide biosynthesis C-terminal domain-containing protein [Ruminococcus sp.]|nr:polysaccharide biosynthesis C-terminal domain-containing protein [Ruminococcus sp.]
MKKQNILKGSIILMISAVVAKGFGALFKIPLTNLLGGVGMSYFSCAYNLFLPVYALTATGLSSAVARMTAQSAALGMYDNIRRIRSTALLLFTVIGVLGSFAIVLLAFPFSVMSTGGTESVLALMMIAPSVLFGCVIAVERGYYEGLSNMYPTAISQAVESVVKVVAGLCLCNYVNSNGSRIMAHFSFISDVRALSAAAGILGVSMSSFGAMLFLMLLAVFGKKHSNGESLVYSRLRISQELLKTSLPVGVSSVVTNLTSIVDMWTMIVCITHFGCRMFVPASVVDEDIPYFVYGSFSGIALTVFNLVPSVTNMLGKGALPSITSAWAERNHSALEKGTLQALMTAAVISVPSAFGLGVLAPEILHMLFPKQSEEVEISVSALRLLMPGMVCLCLSYPVFSLLQAIGMPFVPLKIMLAGTALKLAGNIVLIPVMGVNGAALSTSVCYLVILIASLVVYVNRSGIDLPLSPFLKVLYAGVMCGGSSYLATGICFRVVLVKSIALVVPIVTGAGIYFLSLAILSAGQKRGPSSDCPL